MSVYVAIDHAKIATFCQKWQITELALFGSVLRDDFRPDSDVNVLVTLHPDAPLLVSEVIFMNVDLQAIIQRKVSLTFIESLRNPFRRHEILSTSEVVYTAEQQDKDKPST